MIKNQMMKKYYVVEILIFLMLVTPTILQVLKLSLLILIFLIYLKDKSILKIRVSYTTIIWISIYTLLNFLMLIHGTINNIPVFKQLFPSTILWPIVFLFVFIPSAKNINLSKIFYRSLVMIICLFFYTFFSYYINLPFINFIQLIFPFTINDYSGFVSYFTPSITSFIVIIPYLLGVSYSRDNLSNMEKIKLSILLLLSITAIFITGRRVILLIILLSVIIYTLYDILIKRNFSSFFKLVLLGISSVLILFILSNFFPDSRIFNFDASLISEGDLQRKLQLYDLLDGWSNKPIFGHGLGVNSNVIRSETVPGAYELSYVALLFQGGLLGFLITVGLYLYVLISIFVMSLRNDTMSSISLCVSLLCLLIANATNPYIQSFDSSWLIFYILATVNNSKIKKKEIK